MALMLLLIPVVSGGDHFQMFRFFQPTYPMLCLVVVLSAQRLRLLESLVRCASGWNTPSRLTTTVCIALLSLVWLYSFAHEDCWSSLRRGSPIEHEFRIATRGATKGRQLHDLFRARSPLPSVGVVTAGGFKRTYPGEVVDLMGLNSTVMAHVEGKREGIKNHAGFEPAGFYALTPDVVLATLPKTPDATNKSDRWLRGIFREVRFQELYSYGRLRSERAGATKSLRAFVRKELLGELVASGGWSFREDERWSRNWVGSKRDGGAPGTPRGR
jgi:hypothetical protein